MSTPTSDTTPLTRKVIPEWAVSHRGRVRELATSYDDALLALRDYMDLTGCDRSELAIQFRFRVEALTPWAPVTRESDYDALADTLLPAGAVIEL